MPPSKKSDNGPKIAVINITPSRIRNSIKNTVHGVKMGTMAVSATERLGPGILCIIRQISGKYKTGVTGIWYFYDLADIEGKSESLWNPSTGWKYKILMKPLVKQFKTPFFEEFFEDVPGQPEIKKSLKVYDLLDSDIQGNIQGAITVDFRDPDLPKRYLKAIIDEKKDECNIRVDYGTINNKERNINVYEFLDDLVGEITYLKPNRGEISRNVPRLEVRRKRTKGYSKVESRVDVKHHVDVDDIKTIEISGAGLAFCPTCETLLRGKTTRGGASVLFCKECNIGYKTISK